jgi:glycosyltransferase involved in cell wall biosynthesis
VLEQIVAMFPAADLFSIVDFIPPEQRKFLLDKPVRTSFIQKLPRVKSLYRMYLPLMPIAVEQFDLSAYNLIISSSYAVAKGVLTGPDQLHICYCHSPIRYGWDMQNQYLRQIGIKGAITSVLARILLHYIRMWDLRTSHGVNFFIANSTFVARRINKVYGREAQVIYPPVDTSAFSINGAKENFYVTASRMVPYKKIDLIVKAFSEMPEKHLVVIGDGPELSKIKRLVTPNIKLLGYQPADVLISYMQRARAFVFAAEEDFGIAPVEAQACGTPVIAFAKGGVRETVIPGETGLFFKEQTVISLQQAIRNFECLEGAFHPERCRLNAMRFSIPQFRRNMTAVVEREWKTFNSVSTPPGLVEELCL